MPSHAARSFYIVMIFMGAGVAYSQTPSKDAANVGIGGASHLSAELFRSMTGANIVNVNYKGTGPALNALIANEVQIMFARRG